MQTCSLSDINHYVKHIIKFIHYMGRRCVTSRDLLWTDMRPADSRTELNSQSIGIN